MAKEKEKPLTRKDVERAIEEHGGTARGLDLSGKVFEEAIDLSGLDLQGIILKDARFPTHFEGAQLVGAKFDGSDLHGADLRSINLQYARFTMLNNQPTCLAIADLRGSSLLNANFQGADLTGAKFGEIEGETLLLAMPDNTDFRGANLFRANFKGCYFYGTKLEGACIRGADIYDAHLEEADWGNYKNGEEISHDFYSAVIIYRRLKVWYTQKGYSEIAGEFFFRETEAKRKELCRFKRLSLEHLKLQGSYCLFGHGERWMRLFFGWILGGILGIGLIYFSFRGVSPHTFTIESLLQSWHYSAVSFTALGYGPWFNKIQVCGWVQAFGAIESFIGVFLIALFLVTFVRKLAR